ncbi:MAG: AraC family transcriptional regulator [Eubacteriales bacterium]|nr:AraC family transcriptional regulator [Eubacteriales bacterium]
MKITEMRWEVERRTGRKAANLSGADLRILFEELGNDPEHYYQELEMGSPYVETHRDVSHTQDVVGPHSHGFYELIYVESGALQYLLGTERYRLRRGDIILIAPGVSHQPLSLEHLAEPYRRCIVWISPEYLDLLRKVYPGILRLEGHQVLRTTGTSWEFLRDLFENGVKEAEQNAAHCDAMVAANTMALLVQLTRVLEAPHIPAPQAEAPELIDEIVRYLEENLGDKITLDYAACLFHISKSTVSQLFRRHLNISFYQYLTQRRLIAAKERILQGCPFDQVALEIGFSDYSTFFRAFRREYGISPSQYRKMLP